jgi:hypothetical protein
VVYKNKVKILQSLLTPSIFNIDRFDLKIIKDSLMNNVIAIYFYVRKFI